MKYTIEITTRFEVTTDDIERTISNYEFPTFPDLEESAVEFLDGGTSWEIAE